MDRDPFDFAPEGAVAETEVERPEAGEDDLALMAPVLAALKTVRDPEIPMDLVELGLIYELIVKQGGTVYVEMTLTTPACPVAASMPVRSRLQFVLSPASTMFGSSSYGRLPGVPSG